MYIRKIFVTLLLSISLPAAADFITVAPAYEVPLSGVTVPVSRNGSLVFKQCEDCAIKTIRMTTRTQFVVDGHAVDLQEFRKQVLRSRDRDQVLVTIQHQIESDTVISVSVSL